MAECGVASRRSSEALILKGNVKVNGAVVKTLGTKVNPQRDVVEFNGKALKTAHKKIYIMLNKPRGVVTSCKQYQEKTILDLVDIEERIFPVGRLDKDTEGLILLTNDGEAAYKLTHPKFEHEKEYLVEVNEKISPKQIDQLKKGISLDGKKTAFARIKRLSDKKFLMTIHEGMNRQIRKMCKRVGLTVTRLKRIRIGKIELEDLKSGEWRFLKKLV